MEATTAPGTDLAEPSAARSFELAEQTFTAEQRKQVARFLRVEETEPALIPYLALCADLKLSPVMGEIWLIPTKNGVRPTIGRDGLLKVARRDSSYIACPSGVVCANDKFRYWWDEEKGDDGNWRWEYEPAAVPEAYAEGADPREYRGVILGAWACLKLRGRPSEFYFADLREHGRVKSQDGATAWEGAWEYTSAMILKSAVSYVCRIGTGVTGVLPADEMWLDSTATEIPAEDQTQVDPVTEAVAAIDGIPGEGWPDELRSALREAVREANVLDPWSWTAAKVNMTLGGASAEVASVVLGDLEAENERRRVSATTSMGDEYQGDPEPEQMSDAQVIPDDAREVEAKDVTPGLEVLYEGEWETVADTGAVELEDSADGAGGVVLFLEGSDVEHPWQLDPLESVHVRDPEPVKAPDADPK